MKYEEAKKLTRSDFKRTYGVYPEIFENMVKVVKVERMLQKKTGRREQLTSEDQVLITLSYWREYRTYFHLGQEWGVHESTAFRIVRRVEDLLLKSGRFALPGKKF
jgi:Helix-turn-helix of DDE superfamily endonuclease